jgi:hypothetical protein
MHSELNTFDQDNDDMDMNLSSISETIPGEFDADVY